jgi:GNAT superfamily N-acetyltransferase
VKNITATTLLSDGQEAPIETHSVEPNDLEYLQFFRRIVHLHRDAALVTHGLIALSNEAGKYFDRNPFEQAASDYQRYAQSREEHFIHWIIVKGRKKQQAHIGGIVEWTPITTGEAVILRLYVLKAFRRRGLATALLAEAIRQMTGQGYRFVTALPQRNPRDGKGFLIRDGFFQTMPGVFQKDLRVPTESDALSEELEPIVVVND